MRIYSVKNCEFTGRLKHGDLIKKLNDLNEAARVKALKIAANSDASSNASLNKIFDNPEHLTPKDHSKINALGTASGSGTYSTVGSAFTESSDTWSIYSLLS